MMRPTYGKFTVMQQTETVDMISVQEEYMWS